MQGKNPIRPPEHGDGRTLQVQEIFVTIQGEGPHAGTPAVFIRLGGCNLACHFCDTEFEHFAEMELETISSRVQELAGNAKLVVITGGEPLRQNIVPLCEDLGVRGFRVQIETNGTLWRPLPDSVEIVCSPKNTGQGYKPLREDVLKRVLALKFVVSATDPLYFDIGDVGQSAYPTPVYIQPMDEYDTAKNQANLAHALKLSQQHNARLSLQLHKMIGVA